MGIYHLGAILYKYYVPLLPIKNQQGRELTSCTDGITRAAKNNIMNPKAQTREP